MAGGVYRGPPIVIQLFRPIESLLQSGQDLVKNCAAVAGGKLDRRCRKGRLTFGHRVTALVVFLLGATIDKTLSEIDNKYWTRICKRVRLEAAKQHVRCPMDRSFLGVSIDC